MKIQEKKRGKIYRLSCYSCIASEKQTNESFEIEQLSLEELDGHLSKFLLAVKKKNGDESEPTTLRSFLSSVERYLKKRRYSESI